MIHDQQRAPDLPVHNKNTHSCSFSFVQKMILSSSHDTNTRVTNDGVRTRALLAWACPSGHENMAIHTILLYCCCRRERHRSSSSRQYIIVVVALLCSKAVRQYYYFYRMCCGETSSSSSSSYILLYCWLILRDDAAYARQTQSKYRCR